MLPFQGVRKRGRLSACIRSKDVDEIVHTLSLLAGSFGGINLEDIAAPRCFEIERKLKAALDIPVFHDDQHGTAVVAAAALINALRLTERTPAQTRIVISGAGAAGISLARHFLSLGVQDIILCDKCGILCRGMAGLNPAQAAIAGATNPAQKTGTLADALRGADVFFGVSAPNLVTPEMVALHGGAAARLPHGQPRAGNQPAGRQAWRCVCCRHGPQRLSQSNQ